MRRVRGFTIVELLVVVSIIVVLIALLVPALDRAMYRAQLMLCQGNLDGQSTGLITYAMSNRTNYPHRDGVDDGDWEPHKLYQSVHAGPPRDERTLLEGYVSLDQFLDPFCQKIVLDKPATMVNDVVFRNTHQWAGFRWFGNGPGMSKLGKKLTFLNDVNYPQPREFKFSFLASDRDFINTEQLIVDSSHPDKEEKLISLKWQSDDVGGGFGILADTALQATYSGWFRTSSAYRGPSDLSYAYDDGSVQMYNDVLHKDDERFTRVPHFANVTGVPLVGIWPTQWDNVPIR